MPIITQSINKTTIKQQRRGIPPLREILKQKGISPIGPNTFLSCECYHHESGHVLGIGKCDYPYCDCLAFTQLEFKLEVSISLIDIFKIENGGSEDSPQFWLEFERWKNIYEGT